MAAEWVMDELRAADLKDKRLNNRLREVLSQLSGRPTASIPAACGGYAEMTAAYRLFDNEKVTFEKILEAHREATRERIASQPLVLLVQDTSEVDLSRPHEQVQGAGPLDGQARWGALLHLVHAFTPDGTPLGTVHAQHWVRDVEATRSSSLTRAQRASAAIEEKESYRWMSGFDQAREIAGSCAATQFVCVADSEADIYEHLAQAAEYPRAPAWIVRACQNRALQCGSSSPGRHHLREELLAQDALFTSTIQVRGRTPKVSCETRARRQSRRTRDAEVEVRVAGVQLRPPRRADRRLPVVEANAVLVRETNPPADEEPVEWILLTSLPVETVPQIETVIGYYCVRWMIEVFFRVLKSGCRVEERRFEQIDRFLPCLAVYLIIAWRTLFVCRLGRSCPLVSCEVVFEPAEWQSVWKVVSRKDPPSEPPPLETIVRLVAQLGGYVNRKRSDPPGPQTLWIGLQRTHDFALCWKLFGPTKHSKHQLV